MVSLTMFRIGISIADHREKKIHLDNRKDKRMAHLLEVKGLTTAFTGDYGRNVSVDHVSFHVDEGEVVCTGQKILERIGKRHG